MTEVLFATTLSAARERAPWALGELFSRYGPPVTGYLRARSVADPDGAANEVFLRAFQAVGRFEGTEARFRAWLFTIARNLAADESKARRRRPVAVPVATIDLTDVRGTHDPEHDALAHLGAEWVHGMLGALSPDQREVLVLRILGDLTVEQVGVVMGRRPGAVKALQRRGLATLRRLLDEEDTR